MKRGNKGRKESDAIEPKCYFFYDIIIMIYTRYNLSGLKCAKS